VESDTLDQLDNWASHVHDDIAMSVLLLLLASSRVDPSLLEVVTYTFRLPGHDSDRSQ